MRKLSETQQKALAALRRHGGRWHPNCGWFWRGVKSTERTMQALEKRGLVSYDGYTYKIIETEATQ